MKINVIIIYAFDILNKLTEMRLEIFFILLLILLIYTYLKKV